MQEASRPSELVIVTLATSAPGRMLHLKGTDSASAGPAAIPMAAARPENADRKSVNLAKLFSGRLAQRLVDALLPAWPALLKKCQHVLVDPQGDELSRARQRDRKSTRLN